MDTGAITIRGFTLPSLSILLATAVVLISWILATFAPAQLRKLQSSFLVRLVYDSFIERKVYDIVELRVYPVKSCRGIRIRKTNMRMHGLDLDRRWMFVDAETHEFITIRQNSRMTLIKTQVSEDGQNLILSVPPATTTTTTTTDEQQVVSIPAYPSKEWLEAHTTLEDVHIWSDHTDGYMYGPEVSEPFSRFLEQDVRLVYKGPKNRVLGTNAMPEILGRVQSTFFPDQMPLLIASESSISELNQRLIQKGEKAITIERFRPNIIIRGNEPWSEDSWQTVQIVPSSKSRSSGTSNSNNNEKKPLVIDVVARCSRCQVPNVEPNTAEKHKREPWNTLVSYRRIDEGSKYKPCFGMHSVPRSEGEIEVGMQLEVLMETDKHRIIN